MQKRFEPSLDNIKEKIIKYFCAEAECLNSNHGLDCNTCILSSKDGCGSVSKIKRLYMQYKKIKGKE